MKLQQYFVRFAIFLVVITCCDMYPKTQSGDQLYQDVIVDNKVVQKANNHMDCDARYQIIKQLLDQYRRPLTMLDIGASQGYYSLRTAYDYKDAVCVMIEANNPSYPHVADKLLSICRANEKLNNIVLLDKYLTPDGLQHLSECEHFDVVLALNIIHFFKDKWQVAADAILNMGDYVIIEIPPCRPEIKEHKNQLRYSIIDYIIAHGGKVFGTAHRHNPPVSANIYLVETKKKKLDRKTWLLPKTTNDYVIESTFTEKKLTKPVFWPPKTVQTTDWLPGINLLTFKMCNGVYPSIDTIKDRLSTLKSSTHTDWLINNMIIRGSELSWIDVDDLSRSAGAPLKPRLFSDTVLMAHQEFLELEDTQKIEHYYWNVLIKQVKKRYKVAFLSKILKPASLVFTIGSHDSELVSVFLGHGTQVISFDISEEQSSQFDKFKDDNFIISSNEIVTKHTGSATLDNMIALYGKPHLCNMQLDVEAVYSFLKNLTQPIPYLIFKFNINALDQLNNCLLRLTDLGYREFNFSPRHIPMLVLDHNIHIGSTKNWSGADILLHEINEFARLDHDGENLWGYVYARYS